MKNLFFVAIMATMITFSLTSCSKSSTDQLVEQQVTVTSPEFFYVVMQTVKDGDTVWDRAKVYFGSGLKWTDVVAQNEFLQKPGRVWQNKTDGRWYVLIYPGEKLIMGSTAVNPIFIDTMDVPNKNKDSHSPMGAWEILGYVCFAILAVWFAIYLFNSLWRRNHGGCCCPYFPSFRSVRIVRVQRGHNIDQAMHQAEMSENHRLASNIASTLIAKGNLQNANMHWGGENGFSLETNYHLPQ